MRGAWGVDSKEILAGLARRACGVCVRPWVCPWVGVQVAPDPRHRKPDPDRFTIYGFGYFIASSQMTSIYERPNDVNATKIKYILN